MSRDDTFDEGRVSPEAFRRRMACVGRLVRELCSLHRDTDPALITRDAYLMVVSRIIEILANQKDLPTEQLTALSKALAEHRRLDISQAEHASKQNKKATQDNDSAASESRDRPMQIDAMIRDLYGTALPDESSIARDESASSQNDSSPDA